MAGDWNGAATCAAGSVIQVGAAVITQRSCLCRTPLAIGGTRSILCTVN